MKEPILKAVSMPPKVLWAPYLLAVLNFAVMFVVYLLAVGFFTSIGIFPFIKNPIFAVVGVTIGHIVLVIWGKKEPHLSTMVQSKMMLKPNKPFIKTKGRKYQP